MPTTRPGIVAGLIAGLFRLQADRLSTTQTAILLVGILVALSGVAASIHNAIEYPGADLRGRVVCARLMLLGKDPYGNPSVFSDPRLSDAAIQSRVDFVPPAVLVSYAPLAWLPYMTQRYIWVGLEWMFLLASAALLSRLVTDHRARVIYWSIVLFFFCPGPFWLLHLERGQYYVQVLFWVSAWLATSGHSDCERPSSGLPLGIALALRPTVLGILIPLAACGRWRTSTLAVVVAIGVTAATFPLIGCRSILHYQQLVADHDSGAIAPSPVNDAGSDAPSTLIAEGIDVNRQMPGSSASLAFDSVALPWLDHHVLHREPAPNQLWIGKALAACVLAAGSALAFGWRRHLRACLLVGTACMLALDHLVPVRFQYADVLFLLPIAIALPVMLRNKQLGWPALAILLIAGILSGLPQWAHPHYSLRAVGVWLFITTALIVMGSQMRNERTISIT